MLLTQSSKTSLKKSWGRFHKLFSYGLVAVIFMTTGCTMVGPDFVKPEAPIEQEWLKARDASIKNRSFRLQRLVDGV